ncbi:MAG TPA: GAF domain-containing protein, partial [Polyangiaceae bacterium]
MVGTGRANERERERIAALRSYEVLDTPPAPTFDDLVQLASDICGVPIALVSLVDEDRQWFKAKVGLTVNETKRNVAFCTYTIEQDDVFTVKDATHDPRFALNPLVLSDPHIRFYAGAPLRTQNGYALGSLCVIDRVPRELTALQQNALVILARQVTAQLELHRAALELARREADISRQHDAIVSLQHQKDHLIAHVVH